MVSFPPSQAEPPFVLLFSSRLPAKRSAGRAGQAGHPSAATCATGVTCGHLCHRGHLSTAPGGVPLPENRNHGLVRGFTRASPTALAAATAGAAGKGPGTAGRGEAPGAGEKHRERGTPARTGPAARSIAPAARPRAGPAASRARRPGRPTALRAVPTPGPGGSRGAAGNRGLSAARSVPARGGRSGMLGAGCGAAPDSPAPSPWSRSAAPPAAPEAARPLRPPVTRFPGNGRARPAPPLPGGAGTKGPRRGHPAHRQPPTAALCPAAPRMGALKSFKAREYFQAEKHHRKKSRLRVKPL